MQSLGAVHFVAGFADTTCGVSQFTQVIEQQKLKN
jgi:hypothetical protein